MVDRTLEKTFGEKLRESSDFLSRQAKKPVKLVAWRGMPETPRPASLLAMPTKKSQPGNPELAFVSKQEN
jgi:hypothetical protein